MPERSQPLALALLLSCLLVMSSGCTSSRMMKDGKGFGWLGGNKDDLQLQSDSLNFPPPSSLEVPKSVSNASINQATGMAQSSGSTTRNATGAQMPGQPSIANTNHPMVQDGMYGNGTPTGPAIPTAVATNTPSPQYVDPTANQNAAVNLPAPATQLASATSSIPATAPMVQERSIYEMESAGTNQPAPNATAAYAEPSYLEGPTSTVAHASAIEPVTPSPTPSTANTGGTYYQARTQQPRAWRPGSTSDLKTL